jgi:hypothetical protein
MRVFTQDVTIGPLLYPFTVEYDNPQVAAQAVDQHIAKGLSVVIETYHTQQRPLPIVGGPIVEEVIIRVTFNGKEERTWKIK